MCECECERKSRRNSWDTESGQKVRVSGTQCVRGGLQSRCRLEAMLTIEGVAREECRVQRAEPFGGRTADPVHCRPQQ